LHDKIILDLIVQGDGDDFQPFQAPDVFIDSPITLVTSHQYFGPGLDTPVPFDLEGDLAALLPATPAGVPRLEVAQFKE